MTTIVDPPRRASVRGCETPPTHRSVDVDAWRRGALRPSTRVVPEETPVALTYGRVTQAVMMATPTDLADFALGFSLNERIVTDPSEIEALDIVAVEHGIELRMDVADRCMDALLRRRRYIAGATGCGLCGLESLDEALREPPPVVSELRVSAATLAELPAKLARQQTLNQATRAVHAAAFWTEQHGLTLVREDVGRHNALDKLAGAVARKRLHAPEGVVTLTSRVSVELVQKAARMGAPIIIAVSVPTALALRVAEAAGITVIGIARDDGFEVFTHPERVVMPER